MTEIPIINFPTTVVMMDDDRVFLKSMAAFLSGKKLITSVFSNQVKALDFIQENAFSSRFFEGTIERREDDEDFEERVFDVKIRNLHKKVYDPLRFQKVSTVVVDYQMPGMTGVEFCKKIDSPYVQKILLTGVADEQIGIEALNKGWINQYLRKQDKNLPSKLLEAIQFAQTRCFERITHSLFLSSVFPSEDSALVDPAFLDLIKTHLSNHDAIEYYLCDVTGSFVFLDASGNENGIFVNMKDQLDSNVELAEHAIKDRDLKKALKSYEKMICCYDEEGFISASRCEIEKYIYKANQLRGNKTYFYAHSPGMFNLSLSDVNTFKSFISSEA